MIYIWGIMPWNTYFEPSHNITGLEIQIFEEMKEGWR